MLKLRQRFAFTASSSSNFLCPLVNGALARAHAGPGFGPLLLRLGAGIALVYLDISRFFGPLGAPITVARDSIEAAEAATCLDACWLGELSQQPMCPHSLHPAEVKPPTSRRTPGVPHTQRHSTSKRDSRIFIANQISLLASVGLARRTPMRVQPPTS
jgi:hypothetical protein